MSLRLCLVIALSVALSACGNTISARSLEQTTQTKPDRTDEQDAIKWSGDPMVSGRSRFLFTGWNGPALPVWAYVPSNVDPRTAPIMILMHGAKRNPQRYTEEWIEFAERDGFIIVAPEFAKSDFPKSAQYNLGNLFNGKKLRSPETWSYSAIEPLFDSVVARLRGSQKTYTLYGHSAGSQFVHRFLFLQPDTRVSRFLPANAGWYTFPDQDLAWPFGLKNVPVTEAQLQSALAKDVVILLGDQDTDTEHSSLNRSTGAMAQGKHRFERGQTFYAYAKKLAEDRGWEFNWRMRVIPGVSHSNGGIAAGAHDLVE